MWLGVAQRAEQLGYKVNEKNRVRLGKYVSSNTDLVRKKEARLCNGSMRPIWVYKQTDHLDSTIHRFFK